MPSADLDHRHGQGPDPIESAWRRLGPTHSLWRLPAIAAAGCAVIVAALGIAARLTTSGEDQPSWGEVVASTVVNAALVFVAVLLLALSIRLLTRQRRRRGQPVEAGAVSEQRTAGTRRSTTTGHPVVPTTPEGRWAVAASLAVWVPFVGGVAMFAAPVLLVLALRRGDRAWLLVLPVLSTLFLVLFVVAEFAIDHD
jgi:thiosulfate reductase cytochrome b subunit